jgi:small subunit ribosomal protein S20
MGIIANFIPYVTKRRNIPLANTKQALKRSRQAEKHRVENKWQVSRMNTLIKRVLAAIESKDVKNAKAEYKNAVSAIDRMANKGLIHKNKAARHKSRLNKHIVALAA